MAGEVTSKIVNDEPEVLQVVEDQESNIMELDVDRREQAGVKIRGVLYPFRFDVPLSRMLRHQRNSLRIAELAKKGKHTTEEVSKINEAAFSDALPDIPSDIRKLITAVEKLRLVNKWLSMMYSEVVESPLSEASAE